MQRFGVQVLVVVVVIFLLVSSAYSIPQRVFRLVYLMNDPPYWDHICTVFAISPVRAVTAGHCVTLGAVIRLEPSYYLRPSAWMVRNLGVGRDIGVYYISHLDPRIVYYWPIGDAAAARGQMVMISGYSGGIRSFHACHLEDVYVNYIESQFYGRVTNCVGRLMGGLSGAPVLHNDAVVGVFTHLDLSQPYPDGKGGAIGGYFTAFPYALFNISSRR